MAQRKIILRNEEPSIDASSDEMATVVINRLGLMPRKKGSTEHMNKVLVELYERAKRAAREKKPTLALMTVGEMGHFAGITRQTMYDYLRRWIELDLIVKTSYIAQNEKVIIGYKLNGNTLENAFEKARTRINNNLDLTLKIIRELQKTIKNEKIRKSQKKGALKSEEKPKEEQKEPEKQPESEEEESADEHPEEE